MADAQAGTKPDPNADAFTDPSIIAAIENLDPDETLHYADLARSCKKAAVDLQVVSEMKQLGVVKKKGGRHQHKTPLCFAALLPASGLLAGCSIQRNPATSRYQAWFPGASPEASHSRTWGGIRSTVAEAEALQIVLEWCYERHAKFNPTESAECPSLAKCQFAVDEYARVPQGFWLRPKVADEDAVCLPIAKAQSKARGKARGKAKPKGKPRGKAKSQSTPDAAAVPSSPVVGMPIVATPSAVTDSSLPADSAPTVAAPEPAAATNLPPAIVPASCSSEPAAEVGAMEPPGTTPPIELIAGKNASLAKLKDILSGCRKRRNG